MRISPDELLHKLLNTPEAKIAFRHSAWFKAIVMAAYTHGVKHKPAQPEPEKDPLDIFRDALLVVLESNETMQARLIELECVRPHPVAFVAATGAPLYIRDNGTLGTSPEMQTAYATAIAAQHRATGRVR